MSTFEPCVVDSCIAIKLYERGGKPETLHDEAEELFFQLGVEPTPRFVVPGLFYLECLHGLVNQARARNLEREAWDMAEERIFDITLDKKPVDDLIEDALQWSRSQGVDTYDAIYVALAAKEDLPLVTTDEGLIKRMHGKGVTVVHLERYLDDNRIQTPPRTSAEEEQGESGIEASDPVGGEDGAGEG